MVWATCGRKGCEAMATGYGPPLMSKRSRPYCEKHLEVAWNRWTKRRRRKREVERCDDARGGG